MKKLSIMCGIALILTLTSGRAFALSFGLDIGADGTIDDPAEIMISVSDTVEIDIYLLDWPPPPATNLGAIDYTFSWDSSKLSVVSILAKDVKPAGQALWDIAAEYPDGDYIELSLVEFGLGVPGPNPIRLHTVILHCEGPGDGLISVTYDYLSDVLGGDAYYPTPANGIIHQIECTEDEECNDNNVCTVDSCNLDTYVCEYDNVPNGTPCSDGLYCNGDETCQDGVCEDGTPPCPDDSNPCNDCNEDTEICCSAINTSDPCCEDPACMYEDVCTIAINDFYVDGTNGDNTNDGTAPDPDHAWKTITHALNTIPTSITLDEQNRATVHVAASTYDTVMIEGDAETFPLIMVKYISLLGDDGYAETIIDAQETDNAIEFTKEEDSGDTITLDGFTITGGSNFRGGGITVLWADPVISNCNIAGNTASEINGGGIYLQRSNATIENCIISENTAFQQRGGGISCGNESSPTIRNCTIAENGAGCGTDEGGGGLSIGHNSSATVISTILWGNYRDCSPDPVLDQILEQEGSLLTITYSCIQGGHTGEGNTDADPNFFDTDYHLMYGSSCIDSGDSDGAPLTDIDEYERDDHCPTPNTGVGPYQYYERGAREFLGDSDLDGILDDGDSSCAIDDNPCAGGETENCDDNCTFIPNSDQADEDADGVGSICDNCPEHPNSTNLGTCMTTRGGIIVSYRVDGDFIICTIDADCEATGGSCQLDQGDWNGNGCGDVCECYADVSGETGVPDGRVTAYDYTVLQQEFGRDCVQNPPCLADFNEDGKVTARDYSILKTEFGRGDCPACP